MKIGYQGIEGSYSHQASLKFIKNLKYEDVQLVPLITSQNVVEKK